MTCLGLFRPSRTRAGPDPHLDIKILLFAIGAAFGAAGMITGRGWIVFMGIAILLAGVLLRLWRPAVPGEDDEGDEDPRPRES